MYRIHFFIYLVILCIIAGLAFSPSVQAASTVGASSFVINNADTAATGVGVDFRPSVLASSGVGGTNDFGLRLQQSLQASQDSDTLNALYINPTFTDNGHSSVNHNGLIITGGNVGIGTSTPSSTLDLQGNLSVTPLANTTPLTISGYSLTGSDTHPGINVSGTFNTSGNPTALLMNIIGTHVGSTTNSYEFDFQNGGDSELKLRMDGHLGLPTILYGIYNSVEIDSADSSGTGIKLIGGGQGYTEIFSPHHGSNGSGPVDLSGAFGNDFYIGADAQGGYVGPMLGFRAYNKTNTEGDGLVTTAKLVNPDYVTNPGITAVFQVMAGGSETYTTVGGVLANHFSDVGNTTTNETDLYSDTIAGAPTPPTHDAFSGEISPSGTLAWNGDQLTATYTVTFANTASSKRVRAYFAGTNILDTGALTNSSAVTGVINITIIRDSSSSVRATATASFPDASSTQFANYTKITSLDLTASQILKITGTASGTSPATNDIVATQGSVYMYGHTQGSVSCSTCSPVR